MNAVRIGTAVVALLASTLHLIVLRRFCAANGGLDSLYYAGDGTPWLSLCALHPLGVLALIGAGLALWDADRKRRKPGGPSRPWVLSLGALSLGVSALGLMWIYGLDSDFVDNYGGTPFFSTGR